ncbi:ABC transporter substrate-binding protein [Rubrimonas cliftonensis]|uniref:Carbohydrate ABC transporter substrate-binding protein, CUT1 family n=1 Tax=Rubrimonas cliftonensis TaxID=89524 RepID=A0A1H3YMU2_9RHOB|nr:ABC transporter substrate-binding protein [Rubrimonas cliftonensis]SEA12358.1 carbohydrate ABC transporter substrate-binding protein, CUT1 family [Rubrimonas cliftonensis]
MNLTRRSLLRSTAATGALAMATSLTGWAKAWAQTSMLHAPEEGATLQLLRWRRFIQSEEDSFMALVAAFTAATGVPVEVLSEGMDDVQPKASVAANVGSGPDMFWGLYSLPHLFSDRCIDVTDVADYIGNKYGGWAPSAEVYGKSGDQWIALPVAYNANLINYRQSAIAEAGFSEMPGDTEGFLELNRALNRIGKPAGMALGFASGDGNAWVHWCLWSHGGNLVDADDNVIINSPETEAALVYAKNLYDVWIPGTASWNDSFNNKAFLAEEVFLTNNGVSIYAAAQNAAAEGDEKMAAMAEDINHAYWPVGPVGKPTEFHICYPLMGMTYTKYPNAVKAFMQFMMEAENYGPWLNGARAYLSHAYAAGEDFAVWTADPKFAPAKPAAYRTLTAGGLGSVGEKAASALADFVVLSMIANACSGRSTPQDAMRVAERQAQRIYR